MSEKLLQTQVDWRADEKALASGSAIVIPSPNLMELQLPRELVFRRVYLHLEIKTSVVADYFVFGKLDFIESNLLVARLPAGIVLNASGSTFVRRSAVRLGSVNVGPAGPDCISLDLSRMFTGGDRTLFVSPFRLNVQASAVRFGIDSCGVQTGQIDNLKIWLGVLSSANPL